MSVFHYWDQFERLIPADCYVGIMDCCTDESQLFAVIAFDATTAWKIQLIINRSKCIFHNISMLTIVIFCVSIVINCKTDEHAPMNFSAVIIDE